MFVSLGRIITGHPWKVILFVALMCAGVLYGAKNSTFVSDYDATLPNRAELTESIHAIQDKFESRSTLAFLVSGGDERARMRAACELSRKLEETRGVAPGRVYGVGTNTLKYVQEAQGDLQVIGLGDLCEDGGTLSPAVLEGLGPQRAMVLAPNGNLVVYADLNVISGEFDAMLSGIDQQIEGIAKDGVTIAYSGQPAFIAQNDRFSKRIALFFPVIMLLVLLLHWEALRSVQAVVIPILTGLVATALAIGVYGWARLPLDTYAVLAPILVLAVGAGHSVQLLKRYMEEVRERVAVGQRADKASNDAAIVATIASMGPVLTLAVVGAASCLFALLLLDVAALARFGILAGSGIVGALVLELTLVPAIRALLPRPVVKAQFGELSSFWEKGLRKLGGFALRGPRWAIATGLVVFVGLLGAGVALVKPSHSISVYTAASVPIQKTVQRLVDSGVGPYVFDVMIDAGGPGQAFEPAAFGAAREIEAKLKADRSVRSTLSAPAAVDFLYCRFLGEANCASTHVTSADEASQVWNTLLGGGREAGLIDESGQFLRVRAFVDSDETHVAERLISAAESLGHRVTIGGSAVAAKALADGIVRVSLEKAVLLVGIVAVIGGVAFRSWRMALAFAVPSVMTILSNFSYLGWSGTTLNVATAAVATIAVGIGLDYLIYLAFRIREGAKRGLPFMDAALKGHASAGGAALCVAMAVAVGYIVLIFSPGYLLHHWIAVLVPLTMLSSLFGALFVFPFLLRVLGVRLGAARP